MLSSTFDAKTPPRKIQLLSGFSFGGPLDRILSESEPRRAPQNDSDWMLEALRESLSGIGISNPNPAVGCILVDKNGIEISRGSTQAYRGLHAERVAFQKMQNIQAIARLEEATAYVTLEPCSHTGHQPPCVDLLISSKIKRIVIARNDLNPKVGGEGIRKLIAAGKEVQVGLHELEATAWNCPFFAEQILKRPVVILKWTQTLDGQVLDRANPSANPSTASGAYSSWIQQRYDVQLFEAQTALANVPLLKNRGPSLKLPNTPLPLIFDPAGLCLSADHPTPFLQQRPLGYITTTAALKQHGAQRHQNSWLKNEIPLFELKSNLIADLFPLLRSEKMTQLLGHPLQSILIEGGAETLSAWIASGYTDILHVFITPQIARGGHNSIHSPQFANSIRKFDLISSNQLGQDALLELVSPELAQKVFL